MLRKKSSAGRVIEIGAAQERPSRVGWLPPDGRRGSKERAAPRFFFVVRGHTLEWHVTAQGELGATPAGTLDLRRVRAMKRPDGADGAVLELQFEADGGASSAMKIDFGYNGERNAWLHEWSQHVNPDALPDDYDEKPMKI